MAGAAEVLAGIARRPGVVYAALVPNVRGAELALDAGVDELTVTISASETYNQRNVHMSVDESEAVVGEIVRAGRRPVPRRRGRLAARSARPTRATSRRPSVARARPTGCSTRVRRGCTYADTTGMATPRRVDDAASTHVGADVGLHLHETRGTALRQRLRGAASGASPGSTRRSAGSAARRSPHGAAGNLATEELVRRARRPRRRDRHRHRARCSPWPRRSPAARRPRRCPVAWRAAGPRVDARLAGLSRALVRGLQPVLEPQHRCAGRHVPDVRHASIAAAGRHGAVALQAAGGRARVYLGWRLVQGIDWLYCL